MHRNWLLVTLLLCGYGFWKELRPAVPFLTPFLVAPPKNFTKEQLYSEIYPFWTYSYLLMLIPVFVLTDLLRYKPVVLLEAVSLCATWCLLIWGQTIRQMQGMQILFGLASASEVAYYSYIYAAVEPSRYNQVTSYIRAITLIGKCFAYGLSQILISTWISNYLLLNHVTLACLCVSLVFAVCLPRVTPPVLNNERRKNSDENIGTTIEGERQEEVELQRSDSTSVTGSTIATEESTSHRPEPSQTKRFNRFRLYFVELITTIKQSYSSPFIFKWSLWWALATCGFLQVGNYIQNLWATMQSDQSTVYNGVVEAVNTLSCALASFSVQFLHLNWPNVGELVLAATTGVQSLVLILASRINNLWVAYVAYILFNVLYQMMITVATYNVARGLASKSYGLVIGCNTFLALAMQTVLTLAVTDKRGLNLDIRTQTGDAPRLVSANAPWPYPGEEHLKILSLDVTGFIIKHQRKIDQTCAEFSFQFFIYGCYFVSIALIYWVIGVCVLRRHGCTKDFFTLNEQDNNAVDVNVDS